MCERRSKVRDTDNTEKNVRATMCSAFTPRRVHDIRQCLYAKSVKQILGGFVRVCSHQSLFPLIVISAVVRMMKRKFATSRVFQFWLCHSRSARNASSSCLCRTLSFFGMLEFCRPCSCRRLVRVCVVDIVFSRSHRSTLAIIIIACQHDGVFVLVPLVPGCRVGDVGRREVVQVSAKFFWSSMSFLRISALFVLLPRDHNGVVSRPSCSSSGIHCFPMLSLPLSFAVSFTSWVIHSCKVIRNYHRLESCLDSLYLFLISGRRQMPQAQMINPSGMCFQQDWRWTVLDICPSSCNSTLPSSCILRLDSSLSLIDFSGFPQVFNN